MDASRFSRGIVDIVDVSDVEDETNTWEREIERTWDAIPENKKGELKDFKITLERQERKRLKKVEETENVEKGMVRYLNLILDYSEAMNERDMKPTRKLAVRDYASKFIKEFFNQNPISQLGIIVGYDKIALKISELSGNPNQQVRNLAKVTEELLHAGGEFSLQNALDVAAASLRHIPPYGSREILVIVGSLSTCDPGDIFETIESLKDCKIRTSVISLAAQTYVCKQLTQNTHGRYDVILSRSHFETTFMSHVKPYGVESSRPVRREWIRMGFPRKKTNNYPSLCQCHKEFNYSGYFCPKCKAKSCELPTDCQICGRTMVSSSHLARCYHHLLPVAHYRELNEEELPWKGDCFSCLRKLNTEERLVVTCPKCRQRFCVPCDLYIHESLHNCPGCLALN